MTPFAFAGELNDDDAIAALDGFVDKYLQEFHCRDGINDATVAYAVFLVVHEGMPTESRDWTGLTTGGADEDKSYELMEEMLTLLSEDNFVSRAIRAASHVLVYRRAAFVAKAAMYGKREPKVLVQVLQLLDCKRATITGIPEYADASDAMLYKAAIDVMVRFGPQTVSEEYRPDARQEDPNVGEKLVNYLLPRMMFPYVDFDRCVELYKYAIVRGIFGEIVVKDVGNRHPGREWWVLYAKVTDAIIETIVDSRPFAQDLVHYHFGKNGRQDYLYPTPAPSSANAYCFSLDDHAEVRRLVGLPDEPTSTDKLWRSP